MTPLAAVPKDVIGVVPVMRRLSLVCAPRSVVAALATSTHGEALCRPLAPNRATSTPPTETASVSAAGWNSPVLVSPLTHSPGAAAVPAMTPSAPDMVSPALATTCPSGAASVLAMALPTPVSRNPPMGMFAVAGDCPSRDMLCVKARAMSSISELTVPAEIVVPAV